MRARRAFAVAVAGVATLTASLRVEAHKPITSPYTFNEDVFPILRDRCGACHVAGGVAPMSLTTAEETVPWGESIRLELIAGHMPPWAAMTNGARMRHAEGLSARELNVVLTWVTGGTPAGAIDKTPPPLVPMAGWRLGAPDLSVPLPEVTIAADQSEFIREVVVPLDAAARRPLRAVDVLPGTPSLVRSARVSIRPGGSAADDVERTIAVWVPGDAPVALSPGAAFAPPADGELVVRVRYRKTWQHERDVMTDRSAVGLYFSAAPGEPLRAVPLSMPSGLRPAATGRATSSVVVDRVLDAGARAMAIYPTDALGAAAVTVDAIWPSGSRQRVIEFSTRPGWERRYWFDTPFDWPAGTRIQMEIRFDAERGDVPPAGTVLLILNTVARALDRASPQEREPKPIIASR